MAKNMQKERGPSNDEGAEGDVVTITEIRNLGPYYGVYCI
jgi:hypothetical protein